MSLPSAFADLPADAYPMIFEFTDWKTGEVWHTITVDGPGAVHIPACKDYGIEHTDVTIRLGNGEVHYEKYQP